MHSRNGDFHNAPGLVLPPDILKIHIIHAALLQQLIRIHLQRNPGFLPVQQFYSL
jgi:hypothetical protein